jgi:tRNA threonylcarbamoyladenosine biosynthesis protein TsaB
VNLMTLLALDTSTEYCSVALAVFSSDDRSITPASLRASGHVDVPEFFIRHEKTGMQSSLRLLPAIQEVLDEAGYTLRKCSAMAWGAGPGAFTGLRMAAGVVQGLAFALGIPVVPVNTLMATAQATYSCDASIPRVLAALDARMDEVYWAVFEWCEDNACWNTLHPAMVSAPEDVLAPSGPFVLAGNAAAVFGSRLSVIQQAVRVDTQARPHAVHIATLGLQAWRAGHAVPARDALPEYVRHRVALTIDQRRSLSS